MEGEGGRGGQLEVKKNFLTPYPIFESRPPLGPMPKYTTDGYSTSTNASDATISVKPALVLQTWSSTLQNEDKLPENWLRVPKVLVGIGPLPPPLPAVSGWQGRDG
ncbi:hypothetical protein B0H19DRAFT_1058667 [Mycena capillaripes]|nr:hypothetical protein B0H19DRAFT_1058667 [Mycena capillaripes]